MKLDQKEVEIKIKDLEGWVLDNETQAITKTYKFHQCCLESHSELF